MGSHHELIVEISVYDISFHVVEVSGVLLIIVRGYRWLKVDWLVLVLVAMVAPLRPRTTDRWSSWKWMCDQTPRGA